MMSWQNGMHAQCSSSAWKAERSLRTLRADGIAALILRREDLHDSTMIPWSPRVPYARILGCGANNDGHTEKGITFPSGAAQQALAQEVGRGPCAILASADICQPLFF